MTPLIAWNGFYVITAKIRPTRISSMSLPGMGQKKSPVDYGNRHFAEVGTKCLGAGRGGGGGKGGGVFRTQVL